MKNTQLKFIFTLLFSTLFLSACMESMPKYESPAGDFGQYQKAKKDYDTAKKDYEAAKKDYEAVTKKNNNDDIEITSSERLEQKNNNYKQHTAYIESSILVSIYADTTVNADPYGRASPVDVHIFQLDEADSFDTLDYRTLVETDEPSTIDSTFINKQVMQLFPDEKRKIFLELDKEAHYLGILATYSDTSATRWKAIISLQSTRNIVSITLNADGILVSQ